MADQTSNEKGIDRLPAGFAGIFHGGSEDGEMIIARRPVENKLDRGDERASYWQNPRPGEPEE